MKHRLLLFLVAALALSVPAMQADELVVDGTTRTYVPYIPADLGVNRPLLISMHGMNQDANYQKGMLQVEAIADTAKFAVVFPEGISRSWDISGQRDIRFVLAIIDDMAERYSIDRDRVYLSGFSMGGMFTYHAINHIADKIAAFAPISGYPMGGQQYTSSRPVPIIHTHGTSDDVVNFDNAQNILNGWITRNGCSLTPYTTQHYRYNGGTLHQWGPGDDGAEVRLLELYDKGHWISNDGLSTANEIWNFCKNYSLNTPKPTVGITYPISDTEVVAIGTAHNMKTPVEVTAQSEYGDIVSVSVYGDNELLATLTEPPYTFLWEGLETGTHLLRVETTDTEGNTVARAIPVKAKVARNLATISSVFSTPDLIPFGWVTHNGRMFKVGECAGAGCRTMRFTGEPRAFDFGFYVANASGKPDQGFAAYGDRRGRSSLMLMPGNYEVTFETVNYNMPDFGEVRCEVRDNADDSLMGEITVMPTTNIGNNAANPFGEATQGRITFTIDEVTFPRITFYSQATQRANFVLANVKVKKLSGSGIDDVEVSESEAIATDYYDVYGRPASASTRGLIIRRTTHADGSISVEKIVK